MSINVTVTGSPVNIRRGKMMLIDPEEIRKTQLKLKKQLRLLEVRDQSKEIAKNLRKNHSNALQKEYAKYIKEANEKQQEEYEKLRKNETIIENPSSSSDPIPTKCTKKYSEEQKELDREIAKERGNKALEKIRTDRELIEQQKCCRPDRKKQARNIENLRSKMIVSLPKPTTNDSKLRHHNYQKGFHQKSPKKPLKEINKNVSRGNNPQEYQVPKLRSKLPNNFDGQRNDDESPKFPKIVKKIDRISGKNRNKQTPEENLINVSGQNKSASSPNIQKKKNEKSPSPKVLKTRNSSNKKRFKKRLLDITPKKTKNRKNISEFESPISSESLKDDCCETDHLNSSPTTVTEATTDEISEEDFENSFAQLSSSSSTDSICEQNEQGPKLKKKKLFPPNDQSKLPKVTPSKFDKSLEKNKDFSPTRKEKTPSPEKKNQKKMNENNHHPKESKLTKPNKLIKHNSPYCESDLDNVHKHHLVKCYDYNNRFSSTFCICRNKNVMSAIKEESCESNENLDESSNEFSENENYSAETRREETFAKDQGKEENISSSKTQNEIKARQRGREALVKERIHSDYRQLLNDLKILTAQERALRTVYQPIPPPTVFCTNKQDFEKIRNQQHRVQSAFEALQARTYTNNKRDVATSPEPKRTSYARPVPNCPAPSLNLPKSLQPRTVIVREIPSPDSLKSVEQPAPIMDPYALRTVKTSLPKHVYSPSRNTRYSCDHQPPCIHNGLSPSIVQAKQDLENLMRKVEDQQANLNEKKMDCRSGPSWRVRKASPESPRSQLPSQNTNPDETSTFSPSFDAPKQFPKSKKTHDWKKKSSTSSPDSGTSSIYLESSSISSGIPSPNVNTVSSSSSDSPYDGVKVTVSVNEPKNKTKLNRHSEYSEARLCFCPSSVTDSLSRLTVESPNSKESSYFNKRRWFESLPRTDTNSFKRVSTSETCPHLQNSSDDYDPALLYYISRLLCMSHASIEQLTKAMGETSLTSSQTTSLSESIISQECCCSNSKEISCNEECEYNSSQMEMMDPEYHERLHRIHHIINKLRNNPEIWEQISAYENESTFNSSKECSKCDEINEINEPNISPIPNSTSTPIINLRSSSSENTESTWLSKSSQLCSSSSSSVINLYQEMLKRGLIASPKH